MDIRTNMTTPAPSINLTAEVNNFFTNTVLPKINNAPVYKNRKAILKAHIPHAIKNTENLETAITSHPDFAEAASRTNVKSIKFIQTRSDCHLAIHI